MKPIIPLQPIVTCFQTPPTSLLTPPVNNSFPEESTIKSSDNDGRVQYELLE